MLTQVVMVTRGGEAAEVYILFYTQIHPIFRKRIPTLLAFPKNAAQAVKCASLCYFGCELMKYTITLPQKKNLVHFGRPKNILASFVDPKNSFSQNFRPLFLKFVSEAPGDAVYQYSTRRRGEGSSSVIFLMLCAACFMKC